MSEADLIPRPHSATGQSKYRRTVAVGRAAPGDRIGSVYFTNYNTFKIFIYPKSFKIFEELEHASGSENTFIVTTRQGLR